MKNLQKAGVSLIFFCGAMVGTAQASILQGNFTTTFSGTAPVGPAPWVTATVDDHGSSGSVTLTISTAGLSGSENISGFYLNLDTAMNATGLGFSYVGSSSGPSATSIQTGTNSFKADGDGKYDILFNFPTGSGFNAGETVIYNISGIPSLTAGSFNFTSDCSQGCGTGSYYGAAHVQNTGANGASAWIGIVSAGSGTGGWAPPAAVPLPPAAWLFGSGLVGVAVTARRREHSHRA